MQETDFQATVLVCAGSADLQWREPYDRLLLASRARWPGHRVHLAFCERMAPGLAEIFDDLAIDLCDHIQIIALDLPTGSTGSILLGLALRDASRRWPELRFVRHDCALSDADLDGLDGPDPGRPAAADAAMTPSMASSMTSSMASSHCEEQPGA